MEHCLLSINKIKLLDLDTQLSSGRSYPTEAVELSLEDPILKERLVAKALLGTFSDDYTYGQTNMLDVAFSVNKLYIEDKVLYADIDILDTPKGRILNDLFKNNTSLDFHTAFTGDVETDSNGKDYCDYCKNLNLDGILYCFFCKKYL